ncbi:CBS domain-containing protein [Neorhizobium sp. T25_13]|uniref:CBS domain-containing protein n=1 Tax=Neorhizobium sp. T25_13 TaxID=2093830 RepID=UPI000CFA4A45|nr:CBS domain-containing protein [Neorhizobium sp. T25_13]
MLTAQEIMTSEVITAHNADTVGHVAEVLVSRNVSALPVVDDAGMLVGIVSEADLLHRAEIGTEVRPRSWWLKLFKENASLAVDYTTSHSVHVADVMTTKVITVGKTAPISQIADLLDQNKIKRIPVVCDGRVIGMVGRSDIVRAVARANTAEGPQLQRPDDAQIKATILEVWRSQKWASFRASLVEVSDGVVTLSGDFGSAEERKATQILVENVPGVREVLDHRIRLDLAYPAV